MCKFIDLTGKKFGQLVVIELIDRNKQGSIRWLCLCNCGKETIVIGNHLKNNHTKSCGCLRNKMAIKTHLKHGHYKNGKPTETYLSWADMKKRCINPNHKYYKDYGGRGITVCKRWMKFENFLKDMGEVPEGLSLDRKNNNKNYCKSNCRWTTRTEQARNTRRNHLITAFGRTQLLIEWSEETGIPRNTIWMRIFKYGWSIEKALITPVQKRKINV